MRLRSRDGSVQIAHGSTSVIPLHSEQKIIFSLTSTTARASRSARTAGARKMKNASRCAVFSPIPGRRQSSSTRLSRARGRDILSPHGLLEGEARNFKATSELAHLLGHHLLGLTKCLVNPCHNEILEHLDVVRVNHLGLNFDAEHFALAIHRHGDHTTAHGGIERPLGNLFLQLEHFLLHLLGLLHQIAHSTSHVCLLSLRLHQKYRSLLASAHSSGAAPPRPHRPLALRLQVPLTSSRCLSPSPPTVQGQYGTALHVASVLHQEGRQNFLVRGDDRGQTYPA